MATWSAQENRIVAAGGTPAPTPGRARRTDSANAAGRDAEPAGPVIVPAIDPARRSAAQLPAPPWLPPTDRSQWPEGSIPSRRCLAGLHCPAATGHGRHLAARKPDIAAAVGKSPTRVVLPHDWLNHCVPIDWARTVARARPTWRSSRLP